MEIYIHYNSTTLSLRHDSSDTVLALKQQIAFETDFKDTSKINLMFNNIVLEDNQTLSYYNIQKFNTIELTYLTYENPKDSYFFILIFFNCCLMLLSILHFF